MSDDVEYTLITNLKQWGKPKPLRKKLVVLHDMPAIDGKPSAAYCHQLNALDFIEWRESGEPLAEFRFLERTVGDAQGNRLFPSTEAVVEHCKQYGWASVAPLMIASNEVNNQAAVDAEKNSEEQKSESEETTTGDSPSS